MGSGPVIFGYDGSDLAEQAVREAGSLFANKHALIVSVWEAGRAFEVASSPLRAFETPAAPLEEDTAFEVDQANYDDANQLAERGADIAREVGFEADAVAVADNKTVADTLVRLAKECDAQAVVVGSNRQGRVKSMFLGSTTRHVTENAPCPVLVVRGSKIS
jgi:nucleotide-binding universal stress UspA family protein